MKISNVSHFTVKSIISEKIKLRILKTVRNQIDDCAFLIVRHYNWQTNASKNYIKPNSFSYHKVHINAPKKDVFYPCFIRASTDLWLWLLALIFLKIINSSNISPWIAPDPKLLLYSFSLKYTGSVSCSICVALKPLS